MKEVTVISGVHAYLDADGTAWLNAEDVARGLGFVDVHQKKDFATSGEKYETVRWARVNDYLAEFGYSQKVGKEDFLPENMFYRLAMKAKNEVAEKFQVKVADDILPAIRKHGFYATPQTTEDLINNPDLIIGLCQKLKEERAAKAQLQSIVEIQAVQIAEMTPKVSYYDSILQSKEALPISLIAKDYGMSGRKMNKLLKEMEIQYKLRGGAWLVYQKYAEKGYTQTKTELLNNGYSVTYTCWTQKGRIFLYNKLKQRGILPLIEQAN